MQRNYLQVKQFLEEKFPQLRGHISGGNYPPPKSAHYLQQIIAYIQYTTLGLMIFGDGLFAYLPSFLLGPNNTPPSWYLTMKSQYPMQALSLIFLILPTFVQSMQTTGAFEIVLHYGGDGGGAGASDGSAGYEKALTLFSRLETGQFPNGSELIQGLQRFGFKMG